MYNPNVWHMQCYLGAPGGAPLFMIEEGFIPKQLATRLTARTCLKDRYYDKSYADRHFGRRPDTVRFVDDRGEEICKYTLSELLSEPSMPDRDPFENGAIAFRKGRPRDTRQYFTGTDEWKAWLDGWDDARAEETGSDPKADDPRQT